MDDFDKALEYSLKLLSIEPEDEFAKDAMFACREEMWGEDYGDNY